MSQGQFVVLFNIGRDLSHNKRLLLHINTAGATGLLPGKHSGKWCVQEGVATLLVEGTGWVDRKTPYREGIFVVESGAVIRVRPTGSNSTNYLITATTSEATPFEVATLVC